MKYCSNCGTALTRKIPLGDNRPRYTCEACGSIHYQNPKVVAGCIVEWGNQVLLCRRAIEPRYGLWTLPAGFMENDETSLEAAIRETHEEANARVEVLGLFALFNLPYVNQVYMMFRARMLDLDFSPGNESLEVELFDEPGVPWDRLAFPTILHTLRFYYQDRRSGVFRFHVGDIVKHGAEVTFVQRRPAPGAAAGDWPSASAGMER